MYFKHDIYEIPVSIIQVSSYSFNFQDVKVQEFPLLMPKAKPSQAESYLCTPIRMDTEDTYFVTGFKPNATKMTAHHMLIYGCEEPGQQTPGTQTVIRVIGCK